MDPFSQTIVVRYWTGTRDLARVTRLLTLAEEYPESTSDLAGCGAILSAVLLEQAVEAVLTARAEDESSTVASKCRELLESGSSIRKRVEEAPKALSDGLYELRRDSSSVQALHELIGLRNRLVHVPEFTLKTNGTTLNPPEGSTHFQDATLASALANAADDLERRKNPWARVSPTEVRRCLDSVRLYFSQVVEPGFMNEALKTSDLLRRTGPEVIRKPANARSE